MRLALRELRRRPGRFAAAGAILTLIGMLLMFLGGLLDGLLRASTGAVRSVDADVLVFSSTAENAFLRSRIDPDLRSAVTGVAGVERVAGLGVVQLGARTAGGDERDLLDVAVFGTEVPPRGIASLPPSGQVVADDTLRARGVRVGTVLEVGPARSPLVVAAFTSDSSYLGQAALWADPATWRAVLSDNRPDQQLGEGVFQALAVRAGTGTDPSALAGRLDDATGGATASLGVTRAADTLPGVQEQRRTFNQIIGVTVAIAVVVVALFFALLTVERAGLYGVLKALGARSSTLFGGLLTQALVLTALAGVFAAAAAVLLDAVLPPGSIPLRIGPGRLLTSFAELVVAAAIGCGFSLRKVLRVDPASAIGSST